MVGSKYYSLDEAIDLIDNPNRDVCKSVLEKEAQVFIVARGSKTKHQAWEGGYLDHIIETMNLAILFYDSLSSTGRPLGFSLSDTLLVMFLHDLEKPFKQLRGEELGLIDSSGKKYDSVIKDYREILFERYGFKLSEDHLKTIRYVEGENKDYDPRLRVMTELSAFCHMCDIWSARGWYNFPKREGDSWKK